MQRPHVARPESNSASGWKDDPLTMSIQNGLRVSMRKKVVVIPPKYIKRHPSLTLIQISAGNRIYDRQQFMKELSGIFEEVYKDLEEMSLEEFERSLQYVYLYENGEARYC
jgi:hypothetical protein